MNTSIGIYDKATGNRVAAMTFDAFMSQGHFGNLCDTENFGDPVVLYDSFEDTGSSRTSPSSSTPRGTS